MCLPPRRFRRRCERLETVACRGPQIVLCRHVRHAETSDQQQRQRKTANHGITNGEGGTSFFLSVLRLDPRRISPRALRTRCPTRGLRRRCHKRRGGVVHPHSFTRAVREHCQRGRPALMKLAQPRQSTEGCFPNIRSSTAGSMPNSGRRTPRPSSRPPFAGHIDLERPRASARLSRRVAAEELLEQSRKSSCLQWPRAPWASGAACDPGYAPAPASGSIRRCEFRSRPRWRRPRRSPAAGRARAAAAAAGSARTRCR